MTRVPIKYLQIAFLGIAAIACKSETNKEAIVEKPSKQIKTLMESIHDPIKNSRDLEYSDKPSENSIITESVFNQKGVLIKKNTFNAKGNLEKKITFKLDPNGFPIETDEYGFNGSLTSKEVNKFNTQNKLIESNKIDVRGKIINKQTIQVNRDGSKTTTTFTLINRNFVKVKENIQNEKGQIVVNNYFSNGSLASTDSSRYDADGNQIESLQFDLSRNEKVITQYKYDNRRNIIGMIVLDNSLMITSKVLSKYDDQNNLIESVTYGMLGNATRQVRHSYEYDDASNWTKKTTFINGRPVSVTIHRIEYY